MRRLAWYLLVVVGLAAAAPAPARAHPAPFSFVDVRIEAGALDVTFVLHTWDVAHEFAIEQPELVLDPYILGPRAGRLVSLIGGAPAAHRRRPPRDPRRLVGPGTARGPAVGARPGAARPRRRPRSRGGVGGALSLRPESPDLPQRLRGRELATQAILGGGEADYEYFSGTRQGVLAVLQKFVPSGVHHILIGPDHLLFLIGLLLLGGGVRQLLLVVTAFTVAHSITLSLAVLNVVTPPARLVEPIIALSIIYVGVDNLMARGGPRHAGLDRARLRPDSRLRLRQRPARDGSPHRRARLVALLVQRRRGGGTTGGGARRGHHPVRDPGAQRRRGQRIAVAGSILVIAAGAFWFIERVFLSGGMA